MRTVEEIRAEIAEIQAERDWWMEQTSGLSPDRGDFNTYEIAAERRRLSTLLFELREELCCAELRFNLSNCAERYEELYSEDEDNNFTDADYEIELTVEAVEVVSENDAASEEDIALPLLSDSPSLCETSRPNNALVRIRTFFTSFLAFVAWILSGRSRHLRPTTVVIV